MHVRAAIPALLCLGIAGCTGLPTSGPYARSIIDGATTSLVAEPGKVVFDYALLDISRAVLDKVVAVGPGSFYKTFGTKRGGPALIRVGVGDVVQVSIFESSAGGLFIPAEAGSRPGNFVTIPSQTVDRSGTISVPFAGQVPAAGRSLLDIQRDIESRLAKRAVEPQAIVALVEQNASEVAVVGDVVSSTNKFKVRPHGERVLDMISKAGGLKFPGYELFVTLQRGRTKSTVYFPTLVNTPSENIFVAPGDVLYVYREQQKFVAVGALSSVGQTSGLTGLFPFEQERLSLNEAVAKAGGLLDSRASPSQVFLYRLEFRETLEALKVDLRKFPRDQKLIPTIYRANFGDPSSFFFAQSFPMRHKDIVYVANADSVELTKFLTFLRSITSTVSGVAQDVVITKDPVRAVQGTAGN
jgi:polysaccharide export outer membrane protein